eukprot:308342_1
MHPLLNKLHCRQITCRMRSIIVLLALFTAAIFILCNYYITNVAINLLDASTRVQTPQPINIITSHGVLDPRHGPHARIVIATTVVKPTGKEGRGYDMYNNITAIAIANWNYYARLHGYSLNFMNADLISQLKSKNPKIKSYWFKMTMIQFYFDIGYDYVFYTDIDWLFVDMNTRIEDLIAINNDSHIWMCCECHTWRDRCKPLSGTFIIKNSNISKYFLDEWFSLQPAFNDLRLPEQWALEQMLRDPTANHSAPFPSMSIGINTKMNITNPETEEKLNNWKFWKQYVSLLKPYQFMTYDTCLYHETKNAEHNCNDTASCFYKDNAKIYGIHFPAGKKEKRMKQWFDPLRRKYGISSQSIKFVDIE